MTSNPTPAFSTHAGFIRAQLPAWLTLAPEEIRKALRESLLKSNQARHDFKEYLRSLKSPEAYARPMLRQALQRKFPGQRIDESALLVRKWKHHHVLGLVKTAAGTTEQSLLEVALQNFEADEAEGKGIEAGSGIYTQAGGDRKLSSVTPQQLAKLCRDLDIGRYYQYHVEQVLGPTHTLTMTSYVRRLFVEKERHSLAVSLHVARLNNVLTQERYEQLLALVRTGSHPQVRCSHLTLDAVVLPNVLVFEWGSENPQQLLYVPEDPAAPLRLHTDAEDLNQQLADRLSNTPAYLAFFKRLVPLRHRETLLEVRPAWRDWFSVGATGRLIPASLAKPMTYSAIRGHVFLAITRHRIEQIKQDARALVVPTADADLASRQKRLQSYLELGKSVLFFAASFVPIVGEVLLAVSAAQLLGTVYNGFAAWSRGDSNEALEDLMDVVDAATTAVITAGAVKAVGFSAGLVKVRLRGGRERLWNPDLAPYRHLESTLPGGLPADAEGVYNHAGQAYVKLDDRLHAVKRDPGSQQWQLQHPSDPDAYTPPLHGNGTGGWRHAHETPRAWDDLKLIKRLGPDAANITQAQVEPLLLVGGANSSTLRRAHQESLRPPPQLRETLKQFNLEEEINSFDADRAEGSTLTPCTPYIQLHEVCSLPEWPSGRVVNIVDEQGKTLISLGGGTQAIKVPLARFRKGELLYCLESALPTTEFNELLPAEPAPHRTHVENLAQRLSQTVPEHSHRLFTWLEQTLKQPGSGVEQEIGKLVPDLPASQVEEMASVLSHEQRGRLLREKSLTRQQHWEADQYLQQAEASRLLASLHLESMSTPQTPEMMLAALEQLPGWPLSRRLEVRDIGTSGPLLCSSGTGDASQRLLIIREGQHYRPRDSQGRTLAEPSDLPTAISHVLPPTELDAVLRQAQESTLKEAMRKSSQKSLAQGLIAKRAPFKRSDSFPKRHRIEPAFADPAPPAGLTLRADGIYQAPVLPDGSYRYYILDNARYYRVQADDSGWRLIDARSHFRAYQPYLRKHSESGWELDGTVATPFGGVPRPDFEGTAPSDSSETFVSAEPATDYESADEGAIVYTADELQHMRSSASYQQSANHLGSFERANNGRYPLRDTEGQPLRIKSIQATGRTRSGKAYSKALIMPFIEWEGFEKVAALYDEKLTVTPFTAAHQKFPEEASLLGQSTVVTTKAIAKGEALGVYGGELVPSRIAQQRRDPYLLDVHTWAQPGAQVGSTQTPKMVSAFLSFSGDNVLSRINTMFEYSNGTPVRQAKTGYNVEDARFIVDVLTADQSRMRLRLSAFFATEDLAAGTELRWDYGYDEKMIKQLFSKAN
ncbi:hypothetical protein PUP72_03570 [Pseudomonas synxantha]|uniref:dermonecrotic toxin domain-containing protein n=1 Tax=Pseudomonas synxantha TaxID=47883 RepID=UPI0023679B65|nr:DUF6543 domain-containing protein [Pseudomonas synxantha]WDG43088.1 hypothetical protein PUP72_03570 [Pseudomonas synxantha]